MKDILTPNDFFILKIICRNICLKIIHHPMKTLYIIFLSFSFFKDLFCCGMVKQRNLLHVVDLSFDVIFLKYPFNLHYHKHCPINNIQVKCTQISQNVCDIFCMFWQIDRIADFIILVKWLWFLIATTNFLNEWKLINVYIEVLTVQRSCDFYRHAIWWNQSYLVPTQTFTSTLFSFFYQ